MTSIYTKTRLMSSSCSKLINDNTIINYRKKYLSPSLKTFEAYNDPFVIDKGYMQHIWDKQGKKYIDLLGQNLCISVGHCHPVVVDAATEQMKRLSHCTTMYYNEQSACLAKELIDTLPPHPSGEEWVAHFVNSGSEAVDLALQMSRVYTGRPETIAFHKAYHGLQGYAAGVTAIGKATQPGYSSMFSSVSHLQPNNISQLEDHLRFATCGKVGSVIIEPLQGYGGVFPLDNGFMKKTFDLVREHNGICISDEVQTGFGRCGETFWGFQMNNNNVIPDMITIAKGMGNGVGIIGAVITKKSIADAFSTKMFFNTYGANPVACAASRAVLDVLKNTDILDNCNRQGKIFNKRLTELCKKFPSIYKEVRGSGLFQGLEINGSTPEKSGENAFELHRKLRDYGVVIGRGSAMGNVFRIQPPMCITEDDTNYVVDCIEKVGQEWVNKNTVPTWVETLKDL